MTLTADLVLMVIAVICFAAAAVNITSKVNLTAVGLFCWALTVII